MKIIILAIGKIGSSPIKLLIDEYLKRTPWKIQISEFQLKNKLSIDKTREEESKLLLSSCANCYTVLLDENGSQKNSLEFAQIIQNHFDNNSNDLAFIIGGAHGHSDIVKKQANLTLSLGKMTLPHQLARLILVEQIYRAYTINNKHPYHKS